MTGWSTPKYPGDAVRVVGMARGEERGDVRIQLYDGASRPALVAAYLPGETQQVCGDTPKTIAEKHQWCDRETADIFLEFFVDAAKADGWREVAP